MYNPAFEKDACGLAMVATLRGEAGHDIIALALEALRNLEHRGAIGSDAGTGDGAGILTQMPDAFLRDVVGFELPPVGEYAAGLAFLPRDSSERRQQKAGIEKIARSEGLRVLGWRDVPTANENLGKLADEARPAFEQLFVSAGGATHTDAPLTGIALDRVAYRLRKRAGHELGAYFVSLSAALSGTRAWSRRCSSSRSIPTCRMSASPPSSRSCTRATPPTRSRRGRSPAPAHARPQRRDQHGRRQPQLDARRQSQLESELLGDITPLLPICTDGASDSASFDEVLGRLLALTGRSLPHAIMMMVPEAYEKQADITPELRSFYEYHSNQMEPWDGPAALIFTDGTLVGATLDRNGLRPGRWTETTDGLVVIGSETGVLQFEPERIKRRGRLQPGKMFLVDTSQRRIIEDSEIKHDLATMHPWQEWLDAGAVRLAELPEREHIVHPPASITRRQRTFGYTEEEVRILLTPMGRPVSSRSAPWGRTRRSRCSASVRACCSTTSRSSSRR